MHYFMHYESLVSCIAYDVQYCVLLIELSWSSTCVIALSIAIHIDRNILQNNFGLNGLQKGLVTIIILN